MRNELVSMRKNSEKKKKTSANADIALSVKTAVGKISSRVRQKYSLIKPATIPDHVNYAKVEKYLRSVNIEVTRRMFVSYISKHLLPDEHDVKNSNFSLYTHDQIVYYILVDMFKPMLPLAKIIVLFHDVLRPMIYLIGLDATYDRLCANILSKMDGFESTVSSAVVDDMKLDPRLDKPTNTADALVQTIGSIAFYTEIETLSLAKSAKDFYELTPENPPT